MFKIRSCFLSVFEKIDKEQYCRMFPKEGKPQTLLGLPYCFLTNFQPFLMSNNEAVDLLS